ncbi:MAG: formate dehydrogenase accessory sulfurtransferase FdhD [Rhizobiales bacterium]|nr:formate dehydrogenase accessory sulfurtransferase FdhD [Hyphomicrobiales bacterium]
MRPPLVRLKRRAFVAGRASEGERAVPEEVPVALVYDGGTEAVMMASPADLEDFAIGFSVTEGIVASPGEIAGLEIVEQEAGIELRMWLAAPRAEALAHRRRRIAGPTGCGLCGIDSLDEAVRPPPLVGEGRSFAPDEIAAGLRALAAAQSLGRETRAVHAAGWFEPGRGLVAIREDVGRHNALDKLAGALLRADEDSARGMILLTSRVSVEMVAKAAMIGAPFLVAVSAPTALAIRTAEEANVTVAAVARDDGFEVFTHPARIAGAAAIPSSRPPVPSEINVA